MFCRECGAENPEGSKFCKNCGINFEIEEEKPKVKVETTNYQQKSSSYTPKNNKKDDNTWCWGCCICLIFIFIIFAIFGH